MAGQPGRSGGTREGKVGKSYAARSDLNQAVKVGPSEQYGQGAASQRAQQAIPLPNAAGRAQIQAAPPQAPPGPPPAMGPGQAMQAPPPPPGAQDPLRPTENPNEPVTAGLPFGPGQNAMPTPYADGMNGAPSDPVAWLKAIYSVAPSNDLLDLIQHTGAGQ